MKSEPLIMTRYYIYLLVACWLTTATYSQQSSPAVAPLTLRFILQDPTQAPADLYLKDVNGKVVKLNLACGEIGTPQQTIPEAGSLVLFNTAAPESKSPQASIAAWVAVPKPMKRAVAIVVRAPADLTPAYRIVLIDDSLEAFPRGESRIVPLMALETSVAVGEHKIACKPGAITRMPAVTQLDPYNMAQTDFYYKKAGSWIVFSECRNKYLDVFRQIFIVYIRAGGSTPELTTFIDQVPRPVAEK